MSDYAWWELPDECPHCGGPFEAKTGQSVITTVGMTLGPEGVTVLPETAGNWCGACVEAWNARLT